MTAQQQLLLAGGVALLSAAYMMPTLVAVTRFGPACRRILAINFLLGWTVVGWLWAMLLALAPRAAALEHDADWMPWTPGRPESPRRSRLGAGTYRDGCYLVSEHGEARTWAICIDGYWGIAYELDGLQRTAAWVDSSDIPMDVLAHALDATPGHEWRS
jgi:hypothetical protein